ncbi:MULTISPECIES: hypothetical protein [unclassified Acinetobacter]|uniref:hypothetical protein n=1 Tax=unclassified Acinetobacter TaxID=196816 RepID=UPI00129370B3|nr:MULTISPECIES: hypothetical protein [unclassified Acinetobacter]
MTEDLKGVVGVVFSMVVFRQADSNKNIENKLNALMAYIFLFICMINIPYLKIIENDDP